MPKTHVGEGRVAVGDLVGGGDMDHRKVLRAKGLQQLLHARDDLVVHLLLIAGEGIARTRPGIGEIDAHQRRTLAETDAALEAAVLIKFARRIESLLQQTVEFLGVNVAHSLLLEECCVR
ncbi:hypothetical protein [Paracoccus cavernae]|uniref:hypothetical protein n=1 Tax=Paracoccus cavernae TaxID=1571207 RepID=UPI003644A220